MHHIDISVLDYNAACVGVCLNSARLCAGWWLAALVRLWHSLWLWRSEQNQRSSCPATERRTGMWWDDST